MGLFRFAVAVGTGYVLAQPAARRNLAELARHPAVTRLRVRGQDAAADGLRSARHRIDRRNPADPSPSSDTTAMQEGVLPPATEPSGTAMKKDSP